MNDEVALRRLEGDNPISFLAALGVVSCLDRAGRSPTIRWTDDLVPSAVVSGADGINDLVSLVDRDRRWWETASVTLGWNSIPDLKLDPCELREWALAVRDGWIGEPSSPWRRDDIRLLAALVAEGAVAEKGDSKPTHLHFTAGQQHFLEMARRLATGVDIERIQEAMVGPWRYDSDLPSFSWDTSAERVYALRSSDPSKETRLGVPGADWLALLGLKFLPVTAGPMPPSGQRRPMRTTGCDNDWKRGSLRWPIWSCLASPNAVEALLGDVFAVGARSLSSGRKRAARNRRARGRELASRGVSKILESPIRRSDQGGYGSFGAPTVLVDSTLLGR